MHITVTIPVADSAAATAASATLNTKLSSVAAATSFLHLAEVDIEEVEPVVATKRATMTPPRPPPSSIEPSPPPPPSPAPPEPALLAAASEGSEYGDARGSVAGSDAGGRRAGTSTSHSTRSIVERTPPGQWRAPARRNPWGGAPVARVEDVDEEDDAEYY